MIKLNFFIFLWPRVVRSVFVVMKNFFSNAESSEVRLIFDIQLIHTAAVVHKAVALI